MQGRDLGLAVLFDDFRLNDERDPIVPRGLARFEPEHGETSRKTGHTTEN